MGIPVEFLRFGRHDETELKILLWQGQGFKVARLCRLMKKGSCKGARSGDCVGVKVTRSRFQGSQVVKVGEERQLQGCKVR